PDIAEWRASVLASRINVLEGGLRHSVPPREPYQCLEDGLRYSVPPRELYLLSISHGKAVPCHGGGGGIFA
ncbi:MAG: hypothetical protein FWH21_08910, partial [Kiritimatiellaeota bacterium]|nr:hypothetical protein [Kiritimatiellota bacterium]